MNADPVFLYQHRIRIHVGWPGRRCGRGGGVAGVAGAAGVR